MVMNGLGHRRTDSGADGGVLIVSYEELSSHNGLNTRIKGIARALSAVGRHVEIASPSYSPRPGRPGSFDGIRIHAVPMPDLFAKFRIPIVTRIVFVAFLTVCVIRHLGKSRNRFSLVQSEQLYPFIASYVLARKWGARLIVDDPSLLGAFVGEKLKNWPLSSRLLRKVVEAFEALLYKRADYIICSSQRMMGRMRRRLSGSKTVVCHLSNGVDLEEFTVSPNGGPGNRVFFNCSLPYYQNLAALRNILKIVDYFDKHAFGNYSVLVVVNDAALVPADIMGLIESNPRVTLSSNQPSVVPWLHQCDLVLLPYEKGHFTTAGPRLKVFEALACAKVVLSTKEGIDGVSGCVDGQNLIICSGWQDMAVKTIDLISNGRRHQMRTLGREARNLIQSHYSWKRLVKVYEQIIAGDSWLAVGGWDQHTKADARFAT